jgi:hypothetical protein
MNSAHADHTATLLPDSKVLIAGGQAGLGAFTNSAELYDSAAKTWTNVGAMTIERAGHTATLLPCGKVLVAGGQTSSGTTGSAELYDPTTGTWTLTGVMNNPRAGQTATLLLTGGVLVTGGTGGGSVINSAEVYDPVSGQWTMAGTMTDARVSHRAILLANGQVLLEGGYDGSVAIASAELYDVGVGFRPSWQPHITALNTPISLGSSLEILGSKFQGISEASGGNGAQDSPGDYPIVQVRNLETEQTSFLMSTTWSSNSIATEPIQGFPPGYALVTAVVNGIPSPAAVLSVSVAGPIVTVASPTNSSTVAAGTNLLIEAATQDTVGTITQVSFFANKTNLIGIATNSPFNIIWSNVQPGSYTFTAVALDDKGLISTSVAIHITVVFVNQAPSFLEGPNITVDQNAGPQSITNWASNISAGPPNEAGQQLSFILTNDNNALFSAQPALDTNGLLSFTPAANTAGVATVSVILKDDGGTKDGGQDTSGVQTFTISIRPVNQPPSFIKGPDLTLNEDAGPQLIAGWATSISAGPPVEASQTVSFIVTNDNSALFAVQPAVSTNGTLTLTTSTNANGTAHVTVILKDNGGTSNGGQDTSPPQSFTITVIPVNDPPSFTKGADITVNENSGAQTVAGWATAISAGPPDEASQALSFILTNDNAALFSVQPAVSTNGTLTFTVATNANGLAHVSVMLKDSGGTANGGQDTSPPQSFTVKVLKGNVAPSFVKGADVTVNENAGPQIFASWATAISAGPPDEASQVVAFTVTTDNTALFSVQPAISTNGTLTFAASTNANGIAHATVVLKDNGGTANGGQDTSAPQLFTITVRPVNVPPSFIKGADLTVAADAGPQALVGWATGISSGPANEASQTLTFILTNDNNALFSDQPALSANGTLMFTPSTNADGIAHVSVVLKDDGGISNGGQDTSAPQTFTITISGVLQPADVGIIMGSADADSGALTNDISEVSLPNIPSLTWRVLQRTKLSFQALSQYLVLIWYDPEGTQPVAADEVALLQRLYTNGIPMIFAGPNLASAATNLPPDSQATWQALLHLQATGASATNGTVVPLPNTQGDPLLNGPYGPVGVFTLQSNVGQATVTPDADSLAQLTGGDVIVRFPSANDINQNQTRTVTQLFSLDSPGDTNSFPIRTSLIQNSICWLLQCGACASVYPTFGFEVSPLVPEAGIPTTLTMTLGNSGECDGVGYVTTVQLADGLTFVSATSDIGRITQSNQVVSLHGGRLPARQSINFAITVVPQVPGWFTNQVYIQSGSTVPQNRVADFEVIGDALPHWQIALNGPNTVVLSFINGASGRSYSVQRALLQRQSSNYLWTTFTNFTFTPPEFQVLDQVQSSNNGALYRVVPVP